MRLVLYQVALSLIFAAHARAVSGQKVLEQKVTVQLTNADVETVLDKLEAVANVTFMYNPQIFGTEAKQSYTFRNQSLGEVLNKVLVPHQVTYEVFQERIILKRQSSLPEPNVNAPAPSVEAPKRKLTGVVYDEKGAGLPGVSVVLKETQRGTTTVADGSFALEIPDRSDG